MNKREKGFFFCLYVSYHVDISEPESQFQHCHLKMFIKRRKINFLGTYLNLIIKESVQGLVANALLIFPVSFPVIFSSEELNSQKEPQNHFELVKIKIC